MSYNCNVDTLVLRNFEVSLDITDTLIDELEISFETYPIFNPKTVTLCCGETSEMGGEVVETGLEMKDSVVRVDDFTCYGESSGYIWRDLFVGYLFRQSTGYAKFLVVWENGDQVHLVEVLNGKVYKTDVAKVLKSITAIEGNDEE